MSTKRTRIRDPEQTRAALIAATVRLMLRQGYAATSVDQICAQANATKGAFFHHFSGKEAACEAAIQWWGQMGASEYAAAWRNASASARERLLQMIDIMSGFTQRGEPVRCMVGMMSQELGQTHVLIRAACGQELDNWSHEVAQMLEAARLEANPSPDFDAAQVAWYLNSLWQGSMLVSKVKAQPQIIRDNLALARDWIEHLLGEPAKVSHSAG
ncbi:MAG: TetR/AcrR family transcriptional regulator [Opitutales bacterium]